MRGLQAAVLYSSGRHIAPALTSAVVRGAQAQLPLQVQLQGHASRQCNLLWYREDLQDLFYAIAMQILRGSSKSSSGLAGAAEHLHAATSLLQATLVYPGQTSSWETCPMYMSMPATILLSLFSPSAEATAPLSATTCRRTAGRHMRILSAAACKEVVSPYDFITEAVVCLVPDAGLGHVMRSLPPT